MTSDEHDEALVTIGSIHGLMKHLPAHSVVTWMLIYLVLWAHTTTAIAMIESIHGGKQTQIIALTQKFGHALFADLAVSLCILCLSTCTVTPCYVYSCD